MGRLMARVGVWAALVVGMAASTAGAAGWADALFNENGHDFGPVPRGAKVRHAFVLTNRLAQPVSIVNVHASCGCTTGRAGGSVVAPGASTVVEAEMDTKNFVGKKATVLFVNLLTADGREAEVRLGVSSTILSDIVLNPGTLDFGSVVQKQAATRVLTIDRIGAPNWKIERMVSACRAINASLVETTRKGSEISYTLTVALKPEATAGVIRDEIKLITNDPETESIPILVTAQIRGDLVASPSLLSMGTVTSVGGAVGRFIVRSSKPFGIVGVEGAGDGFRPEPDDAARKTVHVVKVSYRPEEGSARGDLRRVFRVLTDLPGEPPLDLTATLHIAP